MVEPNPSKRYHNAKSALEELKLRQLKAQYRRQVSNNLIEP